MRTSLLLLSGLLVAAAAFPNGQPALTQSETKEIALTGGSEKECSDCSYNSNGCTPGTNWTVNDGCSRCVCTDDDESACTPCKREPTESTVTCEDGLPSCPQDCGQSFNAEKNCYDCPCGVGQPGDTVVAIDEPCPPGTDFREAGAFTKACGPLDQLPQGDTKVCDSPDQRCPADCGLVRVSRAEGCVYCQCGAELAPGDEEIPIDEECRPPLLPGPYQLATKVCRSPTREECLPGSTYNIACDICICQEDGVPACTRRDCSLPKYGDLQVCDAENRQCPADCGVAGSDSYCQHCQCGPRLDDGDIVVPIDQDCPPNFSFKEAQFATKTCKPDGSPEKCTPGEVKQVDCNTCTCTSAGVLACTRKACLPQPLQCRYGQTYVDQCTNICNCDDNGYSCTRKACRPGQDTTVPLACNGTDNLPKLANKRVSCHEGIVKVQSLDEKCLPGAVFMDAEDCNSCFCGENGQEGCTLKLCFKAEGPTV